MILFICFFFKQRLRDEREQKRASLDERHRYLFDIIAIRLAIDRTEVEDNILETPHVSPLKFSFSIIVIQLVRAHGSIFRP